MLEHTKGNDMLTVEVETIKKLAWMEECNQAYLPDKLECIKTLLSHIEQVEKERDHAIRAIGENAGQISILTSRETAQKCAEIADIRCDCETEYSRCSACGVARMIKEEFNL